MSTEEVRRAGILERVRQGELRQTEAATLLGMSYRHTKRLMKRYRASGAAGLVHGNAGRRSRHAQPEAVRQQALELVREHYSGAVGERFGPTLAAEHLHAEHGIEVDHETLRRWMLEAGLWSKERKSRKHRRRRPRKEHFGELLQMDGSFHHWLEERAGRGCLINLVDDATGTTLAWFAEEETTWAVADVLRAWVQTYGIPRAIYTDWKSVYHAPAEGEDQEQRLSQFGQMCAKLGIELIAANSPQAKGRVERNHGTHQDRLIKKMRRLRIASYEDANEYLLKSYLGEHNARFAIGPAQAADFHDPVRSDLDLDTVFCLECDRVVSNDGVIRYNNRMLQLNGEGVGAGFTVQVQERRDGTLRVVRKGQALQWQEIEALPRRIEKRDGRQRRSITIPPATHPWKKMRTIAPKAALWK
jgi:transposase